MREHFHHRMTPLCLGLLWLSVGCGDSPLGPSRVDTAVQDESAARIGETLTPHFFVSCKELGLAERDFMQYVEQQYQRLRIEQAASRRMLDWRGIQIATGGPDPEGPSFMESFVEECPDCETAGPLPKAFCMWRCAARYGQYRVHPSTGAPCELTDASCYFVSLWPNITVKYDCWYTCGNVE
jgi:hypothetical protein